MNTTVTALNGRGRGIPTYEQALAALDQNGRVRAGDGYLVHCPVHDDSTPSLKVSQSPTSGNVLLHCKAGCSFTDIVHAINDRLDGLTLAPITPIPPLPNETSYAEVRMGEGSVRRYGDIWDWWVEKTGIPRNWWEDNSVAIRRGNISFGFGHIAGQDVFKIRSTNPDGKSGGKYTWEPSGPNAICPPLWPMPPSDRPLGDIIVTEGETDCATLRYLGYDNAYAFTKGANSALAKHMAALKPHGLSSVIVCYDSDEPGVIGATREVRDLTRLGIPAQQVALPLPFTATLQGVKDVNDLWHWLEYDREQMLELLEQVLLPPDEARQSWEGIDWEELMLRDIPDAEWIAEGVLRQGWLVLLAGKGKQGKTTLAFHMMEALRTGGQFIGKVKGEYPVVYMNYEMHPSDIKGLLLDMKPARYGAKPLILTNPITPLTAEGLRGFLRQQKKPGVVVVDCARAAFGLAENAENDGAAVGKVLRPLARVARDTGWTVIVIHHFNKREGEPLDVMNVAGNSEWINACDLIMTWSCPNMLEPGKLRLTGRLPSRDDEVIRLTRRTAKFLGPQGEYVKDQAEELVETLLPAREEMAMGSQRLWELSPEGLGITKRRLDLILGRLYSEGRVHRKGKGTKEMPYLYYWAEEDVVVAERGGEY